MPVFVFLTDFSVLITVKVVRFWTGRSGQNSDQTDLYCLPFRHIAVWATIRQNQGNDLCAQRRLGSTWASTQSDQGLRYVLSGQVRTQGFLMRTAKALIRLGGCPVWSWVFTGHTGNFVGFVMRRLTLLKSAMIWVCRFLGFVWCPVLNSCFQACPDLDQRYLATRKYSTT